MRAMIVPAIGLAISLSGCGLLVDAMSKQNEILVSAAPLALTPDQFQSADMPGKKREFLGRVAYESEQKCVSFMNRLVLSRNTVDTAGDIISAGLSGVGALVTPLSAAHALSGAATFVTGSKAAIDADIYAKASLSSFQTAVQNTYFKYMRDYTDKLPGLSENDLVVSNEIAKIESIHATCGLAPAVASIEAKINLPTATTPPPPAPRTAPIRRPPRSLAAPPPPPRRLLEAPTLVPAPIPGATGPATRGAVPGQLF